MMQLFVVPGTEVPPFLYARRGGGVQAGLRQENCTAPLSSMTRLFTRRLSKNKKAEGTFLHLSGLETDIQEPAAGVPIWPCA